MKAEVKVKIADIIIQMRSDFALEGFTEAESLSRHEERYQNFFYNGAQRPDIFIEVKLTDALPRINADQQIFATYHFETGRINWRLFKKRDSYIYKSPLQDKRQVMTVNKHFNRVTAYLLPKKKKGHVWDPLDIIYDFLQILLINYFAQRGSGIFTHSIGVKDLDGRGLLFTGKSGAGKSTTARLWHEHSKAMVLNDDRIIIRKNGRRFFIYGSPWHGEFSDYLAARIESAVLDKIFFIYHSPKNTTRRISQKEAFLELYPALFPTFWDKGHLGNISFFCEELVGKTPCYKMGFVNNKDVIDFVRSIK